jgi:carboxynorspermidine decarboxylase
MNLVDCKDIPSPCYVMIEERLEQNLKLMAHVQQAAEVKVILALKGFSMWSTFDLVKQYLHGATASSVWEAQLARGEMGGEVHAYSPAYKRADIDALSTLVDHLSFNSIAQWHQHREVLVSADVSLGLRVNPENQEAETPLYDPCAPGSRLGIRADELRQVDLTGIDGFHVHNLCECDSFATERTLNAIDEKFAAWLPQLKWLNLGGGHLMTREGYNVEHLISALRTFKAKYPNLEIIMEPGSAVAWDTGPLIAEVVDIVENEGKIAILDVSVTAHMPDVLEMPYRPRILGAGMPGDKPYEYRIGGNSCLAGDIIDVFSFEQPLEAGDRIQFEDMMHYTMVKTTFFNGVEHPAIAIKRKDGSLDIVRQFGYEDFRSRLS